MNDRHAELIDELVSRVSLQRIERHVEVFSEYVGPRLAGSSSELNAAVYTHNEFLKYGLQSTIEEFDAYVDRPIRTRIEVLEPEHRLYITESLAWSADTGRDGVTGELIDAGTGTEAEFAALGEAVRGRIVLARAGKVWRGGVMLFAERRGARGLVWVSRHPGKPINNLGTAGVHIGNPVPDTTFPGIPGLAVSYEDGEELASWCRAGRAVVRLEVSRAREWLRSQNVVATLPGTRYPEQQVTLGAHLDQWSCGAYDSGGQIAGMLELARVLAETPGAVERSVRFCAWGAHEHGAIGSLHYTFESHADEVREAVVSHINVAPIIGGRGQPRGGLRTHTSPEMLHLTEHLVDRYGWRDGWTEDSPYWDLSDHVGFYMRGVPSAQPRGWYLGGTNAYYHSAAADTLRNVDFNEENIRDHLRLLAGLVLETGNGPISPVRYQALGEEFARETQRVQQHAGGHLDLGLLEAGFRRLGDEGARLRRGLDAILAEQRDGSDLEAARREALESMAMRYLSYSRVLADAIYDLRRARSGEQILELPEHEIGLIPAFLAVDTLARLAPETEDYRSLRRRLTAEVERLGGVVDQVVAGLRADADAVEQLAATAAA